MIVDNKKIVHDYHVLFFGQKENIVGTNIEKYYNDFKHVRLVPYSVLKETFDERPESEMSLTVSKHFGLSSKIDYDNFYEDNPADSLEANYRKLIKMNWLINDIQSRGVKEPITLIVNPAFNTKGNRKFKSSVHPGIYRYVAYGLLDLDELCIVFDPFELFSDYPKTNLTEILDLFNDPAGNRFEISLLPNINTYMTPQITNRKDDSIYCKINKTVREWESNVRHLFDKRIKIFIGYDSNHLDATNVCHNSIIDNVPDIFKKSIEIQHLDVSKIDGWNREYKNQSTEFTYSRFLVPYLSNYEGISIFVDDDFIFTENILNLALFISHEKSVACVKHDFDKIEETKFNSQKNVWYPKKLWSSLMVFNNSHPDCKKLTLDTVQKESGQYLHQFEWTDESRIGEIPKKWNWCEGYDCLEDMHKAFGLHWTRGGPWIEGMNCDHIAGLELYDAYRLRDMVGPSCQYSGKFVSILDMREYFDLDNPEAIHIDGTRFCKEINKDVR